MHWNAHVLSIQYDMTYNCPAAQKRTQEPSALKLFSSRDAWCWDEIFRRSDDEDVCRTVLKVWARHKPFYMIFFAAGHAHPVHH